MQAAMRLRDEVIADLRQQRDREADERRWLTLLLADQRSEPDHAHKMKRRPDPPAPVVVALAAQAQKQQRCVTAPPTSMHVPYMVL
jgi:hypothetical protein